MRIKISFILFLSIATSLKSQNFKFKTKVDEVKKSGFNQIILNPQWVGHCKNNFEDLRLFDHKGKEIPYLIKKNTETEHNNILKNLKIQNQLADAKNQILIVQNSENLSLNHLILSLNNAEANRQIRVSGSHDLKNWYIIKDSFYFSAYQSTNDAEILKIIEFPSSKYSYLKLEIKHNNFPKLLINKVSINQSKQFIPDYLKLNTITYQIIDSNNKHTYIFVKSTIPVKIDKLDFDISAPNYYKRSCKIYLPERENEKPKWKSYKRYNINMDGFELQSQGNQIYTSSQTLGNTNINQFMIEIENMDNPPLSINQISFLQSAHLLIADLKKEHTYIMYSGDSLLQAPQYDIAYFTDKIPANMISLNHDKILPKNTEIKGELKENNDQVLIWVGLILVAIFLLFLLKDIIKKMA